MEYNPRYPQPFSLSQAIALDPAIVWDEIARLKNSLLHLRRSQNELQEYLRELASGETDLEVSQAVRENETTMHDERILMLKLALTHHGYSGPSVQTYEPFTSSLSSRPGSMVEHPQNADPTVFSSNGLDDFPPAHRAPGLNQDPGAEAEELEGNGVYL